MNWQLWKVWWFLSSFKGISFQEICTVSKTLQIKIPLQWLQLVTQNLQIHLKIYYKTTLSCSVRHNLTNATYDFRAGPSTNSHHHGNKETSTSQRENIFLILESLQRCAYLPSGAFQPPTYCWSNWDLATSKSTVFYLKLRSFLWTRISVWVKIPICVPVIGNTLHGLILDSVSKGKRGSWKLWSVRPWENKRSVPSRLPFISLCDYRLSGKKLRKAIPI